MDSEKLLTKIFNKILKNKFAALMVTKTVSYKLSVFLFSSKNEEAPNTSIIKIR